MLAPSGGMPGRRLFFPPPGGSSVLTQLCGKIKRRVRNEPFFSTKQAKMLKLVNVTQQVGSLFHPPPPAFVIDLMGEQ